MHEEEGPNARGDRGKTAHTRAQKCGGAVVGNELGIEHRLVLLIERLLKCRFGE